jgi:hypothetical protein
MHLRDGMANELTSKYTALMKFSFPVCCASEFAYDIEYQARMTSFGATHIAGACMRLFWAVTEARNLADSESNIRPCIRREIQQHANN